MKPPKPDRNRFKTVAEYAELCGVARQTIYDRIKMGNLTLTTQVLLNEATQDFVDVEKYPPGRSSRGRKKDANKGSEPETVPEE